jgi:hypothetical protein
MNAVPFPLIPVGRDCDCGNPLVWHGDEQRCAVYGTHPAPAQLVHFRTGPRSTAIDRMLIDLASSPCPASRSVRRRHARARGATT